MGCSSILLHIILFFSTETFQLNQAVSSREKLFAFPIPNLGSHYFLTKIPHLLFYSNALHKSFNCWFFAEALLKSVQQMSNCSGEEYHIYFGCCYSRTQNYNRLTFLRFVVWTHFFCRANWV